MRRHHMRPALPRTEQAARPVPAWTADPEPIGTSLSGLGKTIGPALITKAREMGVTLPSELDEPQR